MSLEKRKNNVYIRLFDVYVRLFDAQINLSCV